MYNKTQVITGLVIFVALVTFPIWYNHLDAGEVPEPERPEDAKQCVLPVEEMRATHMQLLNQWRDEVIRDGKREFDIEIGGKKYARSLQKTCLECHPSRKRFCVKCHEYASVKTYCWDCHVVPIKPEGEPKKEVN